MAAKTIWVRADEPDDYDTRKKLASSALEAGITSIVLREEDTELPRLGRFEAIIRKGDDLFVEGRKVATMVRISSSADLDKASALKGTVDTVIIQARDWKVIPLENLISWFQHTSTKLMAEASGPEEAKLFLETMEVGADGVLIAPRSPADVAKFEGLAGGAAVPVDLTVAKVTSITPLTMGDRVCVDTCSLLSIGEGMLVGSQSGCLFLVSSESMEMEYVASRPFRVNAGAVHAYVLTSSGKTKYLSEVKGGEELLAIASDGRTRKVVVGRAKVERRPLLLVEAEAAGRVWSTVLQNAETIRLCTPGGPVSVSDLTPGAEVLVRLEKGGRHFGTAIDETITEA